jgi:hypothetical protein
MFDLLQNKHTLSMDLFSPTCFVCTVKKHPLLDAPDYIHASVVYRGPTSWLGLEVGSMGKTKNEQWSQEGLQGDSRSRNGLVLKEIEFPTKPNLDLPNRPKTVGNNQISIYVDVGIFCICWAIYSDQ